MWLAFCLAVLCMANKASGASPGCLQQSQAVVHVHVHAGFVHAPPRGWCPKPPQPRPSQVRPIEMPDFVAAVGAIKPSVSRDQLRQFEQWTREYGMAS